MRRIVGAGLGVLALAALGSAAHAADNPRSLKAFLGECKSGDEAHSQYCIAYLVGVWDAVSLVSQLKKEEWLCAADPVNITPGELRKSLENWAAKNPDKLDTDMNVAVYTAYTEAYPCKK